MKLIPLEPTESEIRPGSMKQRTTHPDSTFSRAFGITRTADDDWFDVKLHTDTALFVDPFLIFEADVAPWNSGQERMVSFFNLALHSVAAEDSNRAQLRAKTMFSFPEPPGFCLGFGKESIFGAGSARKLGEAMIESARDSIRAGIVDIDEFGELLLFGEHFGQDRIGDMVCNIVQDLFLLYSADVALRHELPVEEFRVQHAGFDLIGGTWKTKSYLLARNPCWERSTPVLLVPSRFLSDIPDMSNGEFWDWAFDSRGEQLRTELGILISEHVDKKEIIELAKRKPRVVRSLGLDYAGELTENPPQAYDIESDPGLRVEPFRAAEVFRDHAKIEGPEEGDDFFSFILSLVGEFKDFSENRRRSMFWDRQGPRDELAVQAIFETCVFLACKTAGIDISPSSDSGRGPVDFKFSVGWEKRALVEVKLAKSSSYWKNLKSQLLAYLATEDVDNGVFLVIQHLDEHCTDDFLEKTHNVVEEATTGSNKSFEVVFVDVRQQPSASRA